MLTLTRNAEFSSNNSDKTKITLVHDGVVIVVQIIDITLNESRKQVKVGIDAPKDVLIYRNELLLNNKSTS